MIRVLQCVNDMHRAGLETMLMNYYRNIDRSKIQFDFLTHRPYKSDYDDEIVSLGGKVYYAPRLYPHNYPQYFKWMEQFFKEHPEYKIVHSHIDAMSYLPLLASKKAGIPIRIAHSHNTSIDKDMKYWLKQYFRSQITKVATHYCACGDEAGVFLFGSKSYTYIPNAIEVDKFLFNSSIRKKKRDEFGWNNNFVIGHVGRLSYQKNHKFLVKIFEKLIKVEPDALLVLVGEGEKEGEIRSQVKSLGLTDRVQFLGKRTDVNELYQGMDVFIMPSFFEGIPVVGVEAQFSGLPCVFSDRVPQQVKFSDNVFFVSLSEEITTWVKQISDCKKKRRIACAEVVNSNYNIENAHHILADYYLGLVEREL